MMRRTSNRPAPGAGATAGDGLGATDFATAFARVAAHFDRPSSRTVLFSGYPIDLDRPSFEEIDRAALRVGLPRVFPTSEIGGLRRAHAVSDRIRSSDIGKTRKLERLAAARAGDNDVREHTPARPTPDTPRGTVGLQRIYRP